MGFDEKEMGFLLSRFNARKSDFSKNETIMNHGQYGSQICFILEGTAYLCAENGEGNRNILGIFRKGDYITSSMILPPEYAVSYFMAKYPTKAAFFSRDELFRFCSSNREWSTKFISLISRQSATDTYISSYITHGKTVREKLMSFFRYERSVQSSPSITVPIPFTDLADYISCDRSALMKELAAMRKEGIISGKNRNITLLFE